MTFGLYVAGAGVAISLWVIARHQVTVAAQGRATLAVESAALAALLVAVWGYSLRSTEFGADSPYYLGLFRDVCAGGSVHDLGISFQLSLVWIRTLGGFGCSDLAFTVGWTLGVALPVAIAEYWTRGSVRLTAMLLLSFVGLEFLSNAMRQGIASSFLLASFLSWQRMRPVSVFLAVAAVAFHPAAAIGIGAAYVSSLRWQWLAVTGVCVSIWVVAGMPGSGSVVPVDWVVAEIQKYLAHNTDETRVRQVAFASIVAAPAISSVALLATGERGSAKARSVSRQWILVAMCLPFLTIPYFGYRVIYALWPVVMYEAIAAGSSEGGPADGRQMALLAATQFALLALWGFGSSAVRTAVFIDV